MLAAHNDNVKAEMLAIQYQVAAMILGTGSAVPGVSIGLSEDPLRSAARALQTAAGRVEFLPHVALIDGVLHLRGIWVVDGKSEPDRVLLRRGDLVQNSDGTFGVLTRCKSEPREYRVVEGSGMTVRCHRDRPRHARLRMKDARRALAFRMLRKLQLAA